MPNAFKLMAALSILALAAMVGAQQEEAKLQIAIYPFTAVGVEEPVAIAITNAVYRELNKSKKLVIRDKQATRAAIEEIGLQMSGHCDDKCRIEAGKILRASKLVTGSVEKLDQNYYTVSLRVIDVETAQTDYEVTQNCPCSDIVQVRDLAAELAKNFLLVYLETGKKLQPPEPIHVGDNGSVPPTPTPNQQTGALTVQSTPGGARIVVDGEELGVTPKTIQVAAGQHEVTLSLEGYGDASERVDVPVGRQIILSKTLIVVYGSIEITVNAPGASIFLDGAFVGKSISGQSFKIQNAKVGEHKIKVTHPNYETTEVPVYVTHNQNNHIEAPLTGKPGKITISSAPQGAVVKIDGADQGKTPVTLSVSPGSHVVQASLSGYETSQQEVKVSSGSTQAVRFVMKKMQFKGGEMVRVPAGEFIMGADSGDSDEKPVHRVFLDEYFMDKYEVSNSEYEKCVTANVCSAYEKYDGLAAPKQPVVGVDWHQAEAYCKWSGKRLPTEAEWEKAARGANARTYPWGEGIDCSRSNYAECGLKKSQPVGSYPSGASPYGALDMAGNVWEWVADWYDENYYKNSPPRNPTGPGPGKYRALRGGSFDYVPHYQRASTRFRLAPAHRLTNLGIRCAKSP